MYRFLVPGWSAKPLVSAHDRIMGTLWVPETRPWWLTCRDAGRRARGRRGFFVSFSPAVSPNAKKAIGKQISHWHLNRRSATDLAGLAGAINARIRGWFNYYGAF